MTQSSFHNGEMLIAVIYLEKTGLSWQAEYH